MMLEVIGIILFSLFLAVVLSVVSIITMMTFEGEIDRNDILDFIKPKSRTERKVLKEVRRIEREIEEQKRLEELYVKRDELTKKLEGWRK